MKKILAAVLAAGVLWAASTAMATPITGTIDFAGGLQLTTDDGEVTFANAEAVEFIGPHKVKFNTGDLSAIPLEWPVNMTNFTFSSVMSANPVISLWSLTNGSNSYSFDLTDVTVTRTSRTLELFGHGIMHATGFDDTISTWDLTTQSSTGIVTGQISFSDNTATAAPVPEPGTMLLVGAGLFGLAICGKRRMYKA